MHDSSAMPFVHVGLVVALVLTLGVGLIVKQRQARRARRDDGGAPTSEDRHV